MTFWKKIFPTKKERSATDIAVPLPILPEVQPRGTDGTGLTGTVLSTSAISASGRGSGAIHAGDAFFAPVMTEKSNALIAKGQYVFRVAAGVNKPAFARAVARRYGVSVIGVRMLNMPGKERRRGRIIGWKPGFKKAIVSLKKGETIETIT